MCRQRTGHLHPYSLVFLPGLLARLASFFITAKISKNPCRILTDNATGSLLLTPPPPHTHRTAVYISYISHCWNHVLDKWQLEERAFVLTHSLRVESIMGEKRRWWEDESEASASGRRHEEWHSAAFSFLPFLFITHYHSFIAPVFRMVSPVYFILRYTLEASSRRHLEVCLLGDSEFSQLTAERTP